MLVNPPSTGMTVPVTNEEAFSEASQRRAPDNSSGSPYRPIGVWAKDRLAPFFRQDFTILFGREKAGHDGVHSYFLLRPLLRQKTGHVVDARF